MSSIVEAAGDLLTELNEEEEDEDEDEDEDEGDEDGDDEDEDDETPAQAVAKALAPVTASKAMAATSSHATSPDPMGGVAGGTGGAGTVYDILFGTPSAFDRRKSVQRRWPVWTGRAASFRSPHRLRPRPRARSACGCT